MRVTGKPVATSIGVSFIAFAIICAVLLIPGAKNSQSPFLYLCILGGLFVGVPAVLGIAVVYENLGTRDKSDENAAEMGKENVQGLLTNRIRQVSVTAFCLVGAISRWDSVIYGRQRPVDIWVALFSLVLGFVFALIGYQLSFWADRAVLGIVAIQFILTAAHVLPLSSGMLLTLDTARACILTIASAICLIVLVTNFIASPRKKIVSQS